MTFLYPDHSKDRCTTSRQVGMRVRAWVKRRWDLVCLVEEVEEEEETGYG
jgi:hypothetical protein